jgi:hypothetical protein
MRIEIGQLYFPLWKIAPAAGSPGQHEFWLIFRWGLPERLRTSVSLASIVVIVGGVAITSLRRKKFKF